MELKYKIVHGYDAEDYIQITGEELEKAYYCFLTKKDSIFSGGAIRGSQITMIKPDYHKVMGWNRGYELGKYDFEELSEKGIDRKHVHHQSEIEQKVMMLLKTGQEHLIGKNQELGKPTKEISDATKSLVDRFKIK